MNSERLTPRRRAHTAAFLASRSSFDRSIGRRAITRPKTLASMPKLSASARMPGRAMRRFFLDRVRFMRSVGREQGRTIENTEKALVLSPFIQTWILREKPGPDLRDKSFSDCAVLRPQSSGLRCFKYAASAPLDRGRFWLAIPGGLRKCRPDAAD